MRMETPTNPWVRSWSFYGCVYMHKDGTGSAHVETQKGSHDFDDDVVQRNFQGSLEGVIAILVAYLLTEMKEGGVHLLTKPKPTRKRRAKGDRS